MFPKKDDSPKKDAAKKDSGASEKIGKMSRLQRSKDLETSWRTGKQPASGYREEDDPEFAPAEQPPVPVEMTPEGIVECPQCGCPIQPQEPQPVEEAMPAATPPAGAQGML